ncbi:UvrD-helicase domain-containing protein [Desulfobacula sp.]|uniref:UvrD-helicase domain-containing protein n=1 Tax=Desulfobacula sp. TaxID=2593537 RepID=UPI00262F99A2|nr:UvrD-helicase domain-containing protein [Desulfobacula sp.]
MAGPINKIKVAIASDFLLSFSKIPRKQQAKVMDFVTKFRSNPSLSGINYEKIMNSKDKNMRSVRIDNTYRGIVLKPEKGNVYVLLWVAHHDKAYKWAENKFYRIHPETGSLQVIEIEEAAKEKPISHDTKKALFDNIRDRHLLKLGLPKLQIPLIRSLETVGELDQISTQIPQEAYESLFFLAEGFSLEEVLQEIESTEKTKAVDTDDFSSALENPDSRRRFYIVEDDLELAAILNEPLEKWRIFLHPSQQKLVERNWNGPVRVLGGAGTGKTVAAMHRAKWLVRNKFTKDKDRILFTTFTRNLAADIQENLSKICTKDMMRRIEVVNLDRWVSRFLNKNGYDYTIDYGNRTRSLWNKALDLVPADLDFDLSFYREEWTRVIQPQAITSFEEYIKASRVGRGTRLSRKIRKLVWTVFEEYRILLNEEGLREGDDAMRDARLLLREKEQNLSYRSIIVDEAQDMGVQAFKLIRQIIPQETKNDIFIVGDAHQRIYKHRVVLGQCGIKIIGRGRKLRINYRTTDETQKWAVGLLKNIKVDDLDGGDDDQKGYKSLLHGSSPEVKFFDTFQEEIDYITQYLQQMNKDDIQIKEICLVARTNNLINQYKNVIEDKGFETYLIKRTEAEDQNAPGLRLATMHRVKGLEFDRVIIAGVNQGIVPFESSNIQTYDPVIKQEAEVHERALLYVAATRAKKEVIVTSFGSPSKFIMAV